MKYLFIVLSAIFLCCSFHSCSFKNEKLSLDLTELYQLDEILDLNKGKLNIVILSNTECGVCIPFKRQVNALVDTLNMDRAGYGNVAISSINASEQGLGSFYINQIIRQMSYPMILFFDGDGNFTGLLSSGRITDLKNVLTNPKIKQEYFKIWKTDKKNMFENNVMSDAEKINYINNLFLLKKNQTKDLTNSPILSAIKDRDSIDYFYKNYLLASYFFNRGDSALSNKYANNGLKMKLNYLDSILYTPLQPEMVKFKSHKNTVIKQFCFGIDGCTFDFGKYVRGSKDLVKLELHNYFGDILTIQQIGVSCSCYAINMPNLTIMPNNKSIMYLKLIDETKDKFNEEITIASNYGLHKFRVKGILVNN
ncbi:DUF1573 domain-containing protein [Sphingobacterium sp.]|uniref:DUF1573 domain-containing protein n=1 Tax=Sphingobacterium sp. TaxID=341027 RepID=UPI002FDEDEAD